MSGKRIFWVVERKKLGEKEWAIYDPDNTKWKDAMYWARCYRKSYPLAKFRVVAYVPREKR